MVEMIKCVYDLLLCNWGSRIEYGMMVMRNGKLSSNSMQLLHVMDITLDQCVLKLTLHSLKRSHTLVKNL